MSLSEFLLLAILIYLARELLIGLMVLAFVGVIAVATMIIGTVYETYLYFMGRVE